MVALRRKTQDGKSEADGVQQDQSTKAKLGRLPGAVTSLSSLELTSIYTHGLEPAISNVIEARF